MTNKEVRLNQRFQKFLIVKEEICSVLEVVSAQMQKLTSLITANCLEANYEWGVLTERQEDYMACFVSKKEELEYLLNKDEQYW